MHLLPSRSAHHTLLESALHARISIYSCSPIFASMLLMVSCRAGISLGELSLAQRSALVLAAVPLALIKALPRVNKLRFNLEEFAKSDFFKLFDFWKLIEGALGGGASQSGGGAGNGAMPRMTEEREAALPKADPVWQSLNKELWAAKETIAQLEVNVEGLERENAELRASVEDLQARLQQQ